MTAEDKLDVVFGWLAPAHELQVITANCDLINPSIIIVN
jgi:hypothetical protein